MAENEVLMPVFNDELQFYAVIDSGTVNITDDTAFDQSSDDETYDTSYKDRVNQASYVVGSKTTWDVDIDHYPGKEFQEWLFANRHNKNVPLKIIKVYEFAEKDGKYVADECEAASNVTNIDGPASAPIHFTGQISMSSSTWTAGTFDPKTKTFTADVDTSAGA